MATKDLFSDHSKIYAAFRPSYPKALYDFIFSRVKHFDVAWDCATGNGQVAQHLAKHFSKVFATDLSQQQINEAFNADNIFYSVSKAEQTKFEDQQFDLITVGQALHWIDTSLFYEEVKRVGRKDSIIAVWGYALLKVDEQIDKPFLDFYHNRVGPYWDAARKLVEEEYAGIPFPFHKAEEQKFEIVVDWTAEQFAGYLNSWSSTQKFIKAHQHNPVPEFMESISKFWREGEIKQVRFPVFAKVGGVHH